MKTRAWCVVRGAWLLVLASSAAAQTLEQRVAKAPDGSVRFSFAAKPGVYGNGRNMISWDCDKGNCHNRQVDGNWDDHDEWDTPCDSGPVRVALTKRSGRITDLRVYVGGEWRANASASDLGTVGTKDATSFLLSLATRDESHAAEQAIFPAVLADSVTIWPDLLKIAHADNVSRKVKRSAVFWLGQAAGDAATRGLTDLVDDNGADHEVRETAVFALSQRPRDEGVPALIRIAKQNRDPELRRKAIFWLGQSDDPRALSLFEELLTRP
ncbi:MAG TPA: HEAT repeat domain-containing protein [Gemmatimonadales bacterium]|nr:HEAT repeat domain-containing protein [Gemmatimonadales bacterium]